MPCAKILIVDDSEDFLEFCTLALQDKYGIITAKDAEEGKQQIAKQKPDLIILDVYLPGTDGLTLAESLKADSELSSIPIILITGMLNDIDLPAGFWKIGTPAQAFLKKPIDMGTLLTEVGKTLAKARGVDSSKHKLGGYM